MRVRDPRRTTAFALVLSAALGCRPAPTAAPERDAPLATVEVAPQLDATADSTHDPKAAPRPVEALGGVLPGDFPRSFPLPQGGSIIDLGSVDAGGGGAGKSFVVVRYGTPANDVLRRVSGMAQAAGWTRDGNSYSRERRVVAVQATARGMATELRLEYNP
jgi:hypothetical protein